MDHHKERKKYNTANRPRMSLEEKKIHNRENAKRYYYKRTEEQKERDRRNHREAYRLRQEKKKLLNNTI